MTRRTAQCYIGVFELIERKLFKLQPKEIMTDFESGMRLAIEKFWPIAILRGCWFHYCKAIQKRSRRLKLKKLVEENENAGKIHKSIMSLPLLPVNQFNTGYQSIIRFARKKKLFKQFTELFSYFEEYWFPQVCFITN